MNDELRASWKVLRVDILLAVLLYLWLKFGIILVPNFEDIESENIKKLITFGPVALVFAGFLLNHIQGVLKKKK